MLCWVNGQLCFLRLISFPSSNQSKSFYDATTVNKNITNIGGLSLKVPWRYLPVAFEKVRWEVYMAALNTWSMGMNYLKICFVKRKTWFYVGIGIEKDLALVSRPKDAYKYLFHDFGIEFLDKVKLQVCKLPLKKKIKSNNTRVF